MLVHSYLVAQTWAQTSLQIADDWVTAGLSFYLFYINFPGCLTASLSISLQQPQYMCYDICLYVSLSACPSLCLCASLHSKASLAVWAAFCHQAEWRRVGVILWGCEEGRTCDKQVIMRYKLASIHHWNSFFLKSEIKWDENVFHNWS